ncbi:hypothetical protein Y032_0004g2109 [Ancylostoma ceylanicum]|uniref:Uncharacterized protein n=1 Tax=Ancylostoma ceylanicum TaxID=53326 RepID=A0A016VWD7_9BILA|nr:hypothetical protein Y032_0004g2109 [Ancylostoma ceylanicum]
MSIISHLIKAPKKGSGLIISSAVVLLVCRDQVAEWLRRWTANPLGFPRVSSNLILIEAFANGETEPTRDRDPSRMRNSFGAPVLRAKIPEKSLCVSKIRFWERCSKKTVGSGGRVVKAMDC